MILNKLLVEGTNHRIANVDRHAGVVRSSSSKVFLSELMTLGHRWSRR